MTPEERFWSKVDKTDTCWLWTGRLDNKGYAARLNLHGRTWIPYRLTYTWAYGDIAPGLDIDHMCHVTRCVRPDHLQAVSHALNQQNQTDQRKNSSSGVRGVCWVKSRRKWQVQARVNGVAHFGGQFTDLADAQRAAIALRNRLMTNNLDDRRTGAA